MTSFTRLCSHLKPLRVYGIPAFAVLPLPHFFQKFAHAEITHTLLIYLARYRDFASSENMRRVVSLLHRQAVKAKAEGLFFKVSSYCFFDLWRRLLKCFLKNLSFTQASTLDLFKTILADQKSLPREQPYKDLINLINYILRQFFKALAEDSFLAVEVKTNHHDS